MAGEIKNAQQCALYLSGLENDPAQAAKDLAVVLNAVQKQHASYDDAAKAFGELLLSEAIDSPLAREDFALLRALDEPGAATSLRARAHRFQVLKPLIDTLTDTYHVAGPEARRLTARAATYYDGDMSEATKLLTQMAGLEAARRSAGLTGLFDLFIRYGKTTLETGTAEQKRNMFCHVAYDSAALGETPAAALAEYSALAATDKERELVVGAIALSHLQEAPKSGIRLNDLLETIRHARSVRADRQSDFSPDVFDVEAESLAGAVLQAHLRHPELSLAALMERALTVAASYTFAWDAQAAFLDSLDPPKRKAAAHP